MPEIIKSQNDKEINISNIGIFYNSDNKKAYCCAQKINDILQKHKINSQINTTKDFAKEITCAIILGGDGTILKAARFYAEFNVPILGINLGRLGFLSQASANQYEEAINCLLNGNFKIEERTMLSALNEKINALNDIVIKGEAFSRTSRLYVRINDNIVCDYLADGIIISTPTGSTAYTLSAGGPILTPTLDAMVIVPICPHTMNARPIVVPSQEIIKVSSSPTSQPFKLSADGQEIFSIDTDEIIEIKKCKNKAKLILLNIEKNSFYSVLREKLHWGLSWKGQND